MNKSTKQNIFLLSLIGCFSLLIILVGKSLVNPPEIIKSEIDSNVTTFDGHLVVIDPGHGGYDDGSIALDGTLEKDLDLTIALKVKELLAKQNINVVMTRTSDEVSWNEDNADDLQSRLDKATSVDADLMVSLHCNMSEVEKELVKGSEIYVNPLQAKSLELARTINEELKKLSPDLENREIKTDTLHLTYFNTLPTIIVEMGFISNQYDLNFLTNESSQNQLSEKIAQGIVNYLEKK